MTAALIDLTDRSAGSRTGDLLPAVFAAGGPDAVCRTKAMTPPPIVEPPDGDGTTPPPPPDEPGYPLRTLLTVAAVVFITGALIGGLVTSIRSSGGDGDDTATTEVTDTTPATAQPTPPESAFGLEFDGEQLVVRGAEVSEAVAEYGVREADEGEDVQTDPADILAAIRQWVDEVVAPPTADASFADEVVPEFLSQPRPDRTITDFSTVLETDPTVEALVDALTAQAFPVVLVGHANCSGNDTWRGNYTAGTHRAAQVREAILGQLGQLGYEIAIASRSHSDPLEGSPLSDDANKRVEILSQQEFDDLAALDDVDPNGSCEAATG